MSGAARSQTDLIAAHIDGDLFGRFEFFLQIAACVSIVAGIAVIDGAVGDLVGVFASFRIEPVSSG